MQELDNAVDIFDTILTNSEANKARMFKNLEEIEKDVDEQFSDPGMMYLDWVQVMKNYKRTVTDIIVADESIIKLLKDHVSKIRAIAQNAEFTEQNITNVQEMVQTTMQSLEELEKKLEQRDAEINRLKEGTRVQRPVVIPSSTHAPEVQTPPPALKREETMASRAAELLEKIRGSVDKFSALRELKDLNPKQYPPSTWPRRLDFMPARTDLVDGRFPPEWGKARLTIESQLKDLSKDYWMEERYAPIKRVKPTDPRALWDVYGVCHECGATYFKSQGMKDGIRCLDCESRRRLIADYNNAQDEPGFIIEPLTGLTVELFSEVFGPLDEFLPDFFLKDDLLKRYWLLAGSKTGG